MKNIIDVFQIIKDYCITQIFHFWVFIRIYENANLKRLMQLYVHCSVIHNNQDMEAT